MNCQLISLLYLECGPILKRADKLSKNCEKTADAGGQWSEKTQVKGATGSLKIFSESSAGTQHLTRMPVSTTAGVGGSENIQKIR